MFKLLMPLKLILLGLKPDDVHQKNAAKNISQKTIFVVQVFENLSATGIAPFTSYKILIFKRL